MKPCWTRPRPATGAGETLRFWEAQRPVVVVGRSSKIAVEVRGDACRELDIAVVRRTSGGAAVVAGPGCLMYALVLSLELRPALRTVGLAHGFALEMLAAALRPLAAGINRRGTSDLAVADRKVSGNSLRVKRRHLLYHGTLLIRFPLGVDRPGALDAAAAAWISPASFARRLRGQSSLIGRGDPPSGGVDVEGRRALRRLAAGPHRRPGCREVQPPGVERAAIAW